MRHGTSSRRSRSRSGNNGNNSGGGGRKGGQNRMQVFDSNGPEVRIRGTAHQICEKYLVLAKDARSTGDMILAESYLQHAEHYQRVINVWNDNIRDQRDNDSRRDNAYKGNAQNAKQDGAGETDDNDLSLPASILGKQSRTSSEAGNSESVRSSRQESAEGALEEI